MVRRKSRSRGGLNRRGGWKLRLFGAILLAGLIAAGWLWWEQRTFRPDENVWSDQRALVGARDGPKGKAGQEHYDTARPEESNFRRVPFQDMAAAGLSERQIARLHAPIGLPIPAASPWEVAVSVVGEIIAQSRTVESSSAGEAQRLAAA